MTKVRDTTELLLGILSILAVLVSQYFVFMVVPNERVMGAVQRIFYFHVGAAMACYLGCAVLLASSLFYLANRSERADRFAQASAEVSFIFCSIVLVSGMIWGHSAWNTWFRFEPRLVSFLILWILLLSVNLVRAFAEPHKAAKLAAVLAILAAINVPLVVYSVKLLPQAAQLHPQVVENRGLKHPSYWSAFFISMGALCCLTLYMILLRERLEAVKRTVRRLSQKEQF